MEQNSDLIEAQIPDRAILEQQSEVERWLEGKNKYFQRWLKGQGEAFIFRENLSNSLNFR
jgi:hypothetical protein